MKYDFECTECSHVWEVEMRVPEFLKIKSEGIPCTECKAISFNKFNPSQTQVCFVGDAWADKNYKEKAYRTNRTNRIKAAKKDKVFTPTLVPNYKGEETKTWREARAEAVNDGKIGATFDHLVAAETKK